jgi:hypothetical protein
MIIRRAVLCLLGLGLGLGCSDNAAAPQTPEAPSGAVVSLITPNADDGAIVVTLKGPNVTTFEAGSSTYVLYSRIVSPQEARIIVVGNVAAGPLFTVKLGAGQQLSTYSAAVDQVAARSDTLRTSLSGYQLTLAARF